jgi:hypothetical protein
MKTKTYFVIIDDTLFAMEGTSITKLAAELLEVERPIKSMGGGNCYSNVRYSKNRRDIYRCIYIYTSVYDVFQRVEHYWRQDERYTSRRGLSQLPDYISSDIPVCVGGPRTNEEYYADLAHYAALKGVA